VRLFAPPAPPAAPPKRDPGARPEPELEFQSGSGRRYPVLGPPSSRFADRKGN